MQPEFPWNVAGIAPEAREAARVSARREGLSVGEWLTRRILCGLDDGEALREEWSTSAATPRRQPVENSPPSAETSDMLAHVTRSESEMQGSARRIEDQLKSLARRLEQTERSQSENSRAVTDAASEINIVSREQTHAFERLGSHVVHLDERLARIEQHASGEETKEAISALHLGLSRLADQMAETATRSAAQTAQLAGNMESLVGKLAQSREDGQQTWLALEERVITLAASVSSIAGKLLESRDGAEREFRGFETRISATEEMLARLDAAQTSQVRDRAETGRHAAALIQLSDSVETLTRQFTAAERDVSGALTHQGERIARIESQAAETALEARLAAVEQKFGQDLHGLGLRLATADQRHRDAIAELATLVKGVSAQIQSGAAADAPKSDTGSHEQMSPLSSEPGAMPENVSRHEAIARAPSPDTDSSASTIRNSAMSATTARPAGNSLQSFFAAVRNARATASNAQRDSFDKAFSGTASRARQSSARKLTWMILVGALAGVVVAAVAAGILLGRKAPDKSQSAPPSAQTRIAAPAVSNASAVSPQDRLARLAERGNAKAEELVGFQYADGHGRPRNEAEGAKWLERAALQGEAVAAWRLGSMYERGQGVPADRARSVQWYMVAAKAGNRKAMHNLAVDYAQGSGVPKDPAIAAQWFSRAALLGLADSEFDLGVLYERGLGVPQNLTDAYKWYAIAAAQGDAESKARLEALASQISADDRFAAAKSAADFRPQAANTTANSAPDLSAVLGG
ncbi:MAG TPA: hypothetical protein VGL35_11215 [Rhizomicrobium sp.]